MVSLTFFGGVGEIGGNKILLKDRKTRIWLDFGMSFSKSAEFYSDFLGPKKCNGIGDYIELGLVPDIKGLYREDYLKKMGRDKEESGFDGILLSHAHLDHNGHLDLVRPDIPLYCSQGSKCIMEMIDTTSGGEFLREKVSFRFVPKKRGEGLKRLDSREPEGIVERVVNVVEKPFKVGDLEVTPMPVDHSLPGALAFAIETSEGAVIYSGDFRFHGLNEKKTREFVEKASGFEPAAFICEGTRIDSNKTETERDVYSTVTKFCKDCEALIIANYPLRDTDRMTTFLNAAKDHDRKLVVNLKQAFLLDAFGKAGQEAPRLEDVSIYIPRKSWGLVTEDMDPDLVHGDYETWECQFIDAGNSITCEELRKNQDEYLWHCDFFELKELIDVKPMKASKYVWSVTEPFDVVMELDEQIVMNWLAHFNITEITRSHVSGHANGRDLKETIDAIKPKKLFAVHTEHPEMFENVRVVEKGKECEVG
ncbi:MAG: MBL fold metallo-hydrolase [Candidatus Micrarchaeota archaeon]|nr:MBL fold metallo-hydrolase [Candidatus Micrarchaeota archaeon]